MSIPSATIEKNRFSTPDAFRRQVHMGVLWLLNETTNEHPDAKIKILIPTDEQIVKTIKEAKLESPQIDFGIYEHGLIIRITIVIVEKKRMHDSRIKG